MSADSALVQVLQERLRVVQELSGMNARHLLNRQTAAGADFEIMQIEQEIGRSGASPDRTAALQDAQERRERADAAMADDDEALTALEQRLVELDRRIAAGGRE